MSFRNAVNLSHICVKRVVKPGDTVINATCGNGHDTLFLAGLVTSGRVLAFDISPLAIANTAAGWRPMDYSPVELFRGHFAPCRLRKLTVRPSVTGYLRFSRETATVAECSRQAIQADAALLQPGGVMTVVCYPGHEEGAEETRQVLAVTGELNQQEFEVLKVNFINQVHHLPLLVVVQWMEGGRM